MTLWQWARCWLSGKPHFVVGSPDRPYLFRWHILPRNRFVNLYLHKFLRDDDDRALHDHPWVSLSLCLWGRYVEHTRDWTRERNVGSLVYRAATHTHRITLPGGRPSWTLFLTGPHVRDWGFHCPLGWVPWWKFVKTDQPGEVSRGCDQ